MSKEAIAIKALEALARLGNGDQYGNSTGNVIARTALFEMAEQPAQHEPVACKTLCELCVKRGYIFCANSAQTTLIPSPPAQRKPLTDEPEIVQRVKRYAGQTLRTARNPNITARECIELADWLVANGITKGNT